MKTKLKGAVCLIIASASLNAGAANLCTATEHTVFAFATQSKKLLSVCRGPKAGYLAYRFGTPGKVELQFPDKLDASSWKQFEFEGRRRGGGKQNAGFFGYTLAFSNRGASYTIFQDENSEENTYKIGVNIDAGGKQVEIKGVVKSQEGSLIALDDTVDQLPNAANE